MELDRWTRMVRVRKNGQLYSRLCGNKFTDHYSDGGPAPDDPAYLACYMFWDIAPIRAKPPFTEAVLRVLQQTLRLSSLACQEAAIHGLGENVAYATEAVEAILTDYLGRPDLEPALRKYALDARDG